MVRMASLVMGLMLVGMFSGMLASLPKPGPWMNAVKWIFGLGMIAVALFFLWQAGVMVYHRVGS